MDFIFDLIRDFGTKLGEHAMYDLAKEGIGRLFERFRLRSNLPWDPDAGQMQLSREYADLCFHLFVFSEAEHTKLEPPKDWSHAGPNVRLPDGQMTYGHEATVCRKISDFLRRDLGVKHYFDTKSRVTQGPISRVILGSGTSNTDAAAVMGTPEQPLFQTPYCNLRYNIGNAKGTVKRWQYGEWVTRQAHMICDSSGKRIHRPETQNSHQFDDYLLVSRVPRMDKGTTVTLMSGLHGPGSRSAELLFSGLPIDDLRALALMIDLQPGETPFYQAVFRASKFNPNLKDDTTNSDVPTILRLVKEGSPPAKLKPR